MARDPEERRLETTGPKDDAAGIPAVLNSVRMAQKQAGPNRWLPVLKALNKDGGIDCPSCAWPDPDRRRPAEFCENGAKAIANEVTRRSIGRDFFAEHSVADLRRKSGYWLEQQGRLAEPLVLDEGAKHYRPIGWDEALDIIAGELRALDDPDEAAFYTSGRTSNEAAFLYQLLVRRFGTNNLPDCSNMCHESSGTALTETIGVGKGSVLFDDLHSSDLILVVGQNPGTNHPRMLSALEEAKRNGTAIVSVNPLPEAGMKRFHDPQTVRGLVGKGVDLADEHVPVRVGGDLALFSALNRLILESGDTDADFIDRYCNGFEAYREELLAEPEDEFWETVLAHTGLDRGQIERLAERTREADSVIVCWAMGLTQHRHAVPTLREVVNYLLLRGNIGKRGAGVCPVRGHSNVQGDRTMGIWERPTPQFLDALERTFGFAPPREPGLDTVDTLRAMKKGAVKVFMAMGGNFIAASPDTEPTEESIASCRLTVQVSTKLNRSHLATGRRALILPALGRTDRDEQPAGRQFVTVEDSFGVVHSSEGRIPPLSGEMRSEPWIVTALAQKLFGDDEHVDWAALSEDYDRIRDLVEKVVPGFENFNRRVRERNGFALPHPPRDNRAFPTASGKAEFTANGLTAPEAAEDELILQTLRSHDQFNTTVYGLNDRYRGVKHGRTVVFVHPEDAERLGFADGDTVDMVSTGADGAERRARGFRLVHYPTAPGCAAAYYPETNVLVPLDAVAKGSNTPASKSIAIRLERA
ncbi:FdhF/YdeP family oxidoreductase [Salininema proteolyticum]|uniref:FdhF/YdeP family oxidoreductase n=1 Tax=Salininema proteolyticum TaxID=1607685 RepID=A0ABV8U4S5_9ACTN